MDPLLVTHVPVVLLGKSLVLLLTSALPKGLG